MRFRTLLAPALALLTAASLLAGETGTRLQFPENGFSIEPLEASKSADPNQPLTMMLPPVDGFSANVNVQVQPYGGTLEEYVALTRAQLRAAGFELLAEPVVAGPTLTIEYAGTMRGNELRWYATATKKGDQVFLVTATAPRSQWQELGAKLRRVVDSFRLEGRD